MLKWLWGVPPRIGSLWLVRGPGVRVFVSVESVAHGLVTYRMPDGSLWHDSVRDFRLCYREVR